MPKLEPTYTIKDLSGFFQLSQRTIHAYLRDDPRVLKFGPRGRRGKRDHVTLRIPLSVVGELMEEWRKG